MKVSVASVCDRGLSPKRPVNEDRALVRADAGLFVVCDGVGGHNSGEVASQLAVDTIEEALDHDTADTDVDRLRRAIQYANRDIYEMARSRPEFDGMATTVALLQLDLDGGRAVIGHAGDSRVYRFDGLRLHRETFDHTDLDDAIRAGRLSRQQALAIGKQNTINRALGIEHEVQAEFKTISFTEGQSFLLCSDGVTRHLDDDELEEMLGSGLDPAAACEEIKVRCFSRGAEDNLTAIVVHTGEARLPAGERSIDDAEMETRQRVRLGRPIEVDVAKKERPPARRAAQQHSARQSFLLKLLALVLIVAAFAAGRMSNAWAPAQRVVPKPPTEAGRAAFDRGDLPAARAAFTQLTVEEPNRAEYQYWLGRTALRQGETLVAVERLERAVALDQTKQCPDARLYLAAAYQAHGKPEQAASELKRFAEEQKAGATAAAPSQNEPRNSQ